VAAGSVSILSLASGRQMGCHVDGTSLEPRFDRELCHQRTIVERLINRLKQFRRIATRYEKLVVNFLAMVTPAALPIWL
jgi:transposase